MPVYRVLFGLKLSVWPYHSINKLQYFGFVPHTFMTYDVTKHKK